MTDAVVVENLSKRFQIGAMAHETMLREKIVSLLSGIAGRRAATGSRDFWALKEVSFRIPEGQVVGIIGRNGAGKSTLLKTLAKIMYPTSGRVMTHGRLASLLEVGTGFHEELTGRENIFLNGSILGMKRVEVQAQLDNIVQFSEVGQFLDTPIKRYSSGMRLRLGFAVAAHLNPDVLIVDEVLAVGDVGFQRKCLTAMEDLRGGGRTVLFVSHNMAAVENLCTRAIWIDTGQIRLDGPSHDVIERYMATFAEAAGSASDLTGAIGRRGSGEAQYTRVEFFGKEGEGDKLIRTGRGMRIRMYYHVKKPIPHASLGFALRTDMGTLITETSTSHHGIDIPLLPQGDGYIELEIDFLNLLPARYYFSLGLSGGMHHHLYDFVENAAYIDVEPSNIYNCNRVIDSRCGIAYFPQRWNFDGTRAEFFLP